MNKLADDVAVFLNSIKEAGGGALCDLGVEQARTALLQLTLNTCLPRQEVERTNERSIPVEGGEISIRLYWPENSKREKKPLIIQYHGGGWALGDLDTHDTICRYYCNQVSAVVMSIHYRLAPEFTFPTGVEDCYTALCWSVENAESLGIDPQRIAVTGDSAGGNLATVVSILSKERNGPRIKYQALAYPGVDLTPEDVDKYPSIKKFGCGDYFITAEDLVWLKQVYFKTDEDAYTVPASPILSDELAGLPPTLILTAGFDPLVDQGKAYADKLKSVGVDVEYQCLEDTIHGFITFAGAMESGKKGLEIISEKIKKSLYG